MAFGRLFVLVVAICMGLSFAPQQASAHAADHFASGADTRHKFSEGHTSVLLQDHGMIDGMSGRCGVQPCCSSACHSIGYIVGGDTPCPEPVPSVIRVALFSSSVTVGKKTGWHKTPAARLNQSVHF